MVQTIVILNDQQTKWINAQVNKSATVRAALNCLFITIQKNQRFIEEVTINQRMKRNRRSATVRLKIWIRQEQREHLRQIASNSGLDQSSVVRFAIDRYIVSRKIMEKAPSTDLISMLGAVHNKKVSEPCQHSKQAAENQVQVQPVINIQQAVEDDQRFRQQHAAADQAFDILLKGMLEDIPDPVPVSIERRDDSSLRLLFDHVSGDEDPIMKELEQDLRKVLDNS